MITLAVVAAQAEVAHVPVLVELRVHHQVHPAGQRLAREFVDVRCEIERRNKVMIVVELHDEIVRCGAQKCVEICTQSAPG